MNDFKNDTPVGKQDQDSFQRYVFAKRIAQAISERKSISSIVIGIYGEWGEGKTSVLNFVKQELREIRDDYIITDFNPWRYKDENSILISFFNILASHLKDDNSNKKAKFPWKKKDQLSSDKEKAGDLLKTYAKALSPIGLSGLAESLGEQLSSSDTVDLKSRIESKLAAKGKRILICIDDVDRLDKNEIYLLFRLIKLTANFNFISYILALDEVMVAQSISERFGDGQSALAGERFLEKIITVPLHIPPVTKADVVQFFNKLLGELMAYNQIEFGDRDASRLSNIFYSFFLPKISNPRSVIRWMNALSFSLPLLKGICNTVDLITIEGIKITFPLLHEFIKGREDLLIGKLRIKEFEFTKYRIPKDSISKVDIFLENNKEEFYPLEMGDVRELLSNLFPPLANELNKNNSFHSNETDKEWTTEKRIGDANYFQRYFSYTVLKGEISDLVFDQIFICAQEGNKDKINKIVEELVTEHGDNAIVSKLIIYQNNLNRQQALTLVSSIRDLSHLFSKEYEVHSNFSTLSQLTRFFAHILNENCDSEEIFKILSDSIEQNPNFYFCDSFFSSIKSVTPKYSKPILDDSQELEIFKLLKNKAIETSGNDPIFKTYTDFAGYVLLVWSNKINEDEVKNYVKSFLSNDPKLVIDFLKSLANWNKGPSDSKKFFSYDIKAYNNVKNIISPKSIESAIKLAFDEKELSKKAIFDSPPHFDPETYTDINLARQFLQWKKNDEMSRSNKSS